MEIILGSLHTFESLRSSIWKSQDVVDNALELPKSLKKVNELPKNLTYKQTEFLLLRLPSFSHPKGDASVYSEYRITWIHLHSIFDYITWAEDAFPQKFAFERARVIATWKTKSCNQCKRINVHIYLYWQRSARKLTVFTDLGKLRALQTNHECKQKDWHILLIHVHGVPKSAHTSAIN